MTSLPDWLVERAALDEVSPAQRDRLDRVDPNQLAAEIAAVREANASELARHPAAPAVAIIEARVATAAKRKAERRRLHRALGLFGVAMTAAVVLIAFRITARPTEQVASVDRNVQFDTRVKGKTRLSVFRQVGDRAERLDADTLVHPGEVLQLRYSPGAQAYGLIASVDGAGVVTLHYPAREDGSTKIAHESTALPDAYALDDAPKFERFFFITANEPIDVAQTLAELRTFAKRTDSGDAELALPESIHQWSLRLRKPE